MGQSLMKLSPGLGSKEKKVKEIGPIIDYCYDLRFKDAERSQLRFGEFYHGVCLTVEDINRMLGNMQFKLPNVEDLEVAYMRHYQGRDSVLTKEEFHKMLKEVITDSGFTGIVEKEAFLYIFGVPVVATFLKQRVTPRAISDEFFIPSVTSITVLVLAGLNKI